MTWWYDDSRNRAMLLVLITACVEQNQVAAREGFRSAMEVKDERDLACLVRRRPVVRMGAKKFSIVAGSGLDVEMRKSEGRKFQVAGDRGKVRTKPQR